MALPYELLIGLRYTRAKRRNHFISFISLISMLGIGLGVAAPGPNLLFVAVLGWNVAGPMGAVATMTGILLPSTLLTLWATRWGQARRDTRGVRAFTTGMAPLTLGLLVATGWVLTEPVRMQVGAWALIAITVVVMVRTRVSPMWLVALGAVVGAMGYA